MAFSAMALTEENLDFVTRFEISSIKRDLAWMRPLYELGRETGVDYYIVIAYFFELDTFFRESVSIFTAEMFARKYVFVRPDGHGFTQIVPIDEIDV